MIKVTFSFKSQGMEKIELFSQGTRDSIHRRHESLITIDYKYTKQIKLLAFFNVKLLLMEGNC